MGYLSDFADSIVRDYKILIDRASEIIKEETNADDDKVYREYGEFEIQKIKEIFNRAVTTFYSAYDPNSYVREGNVGDQTGGLYSVLEIKQDDYGMAVITAKDVAAGNYAGVFDKGKMPAGRNGVGLFDKVFMNGWHGGAESINADAATVWGKHPHIGTPHYRKPGYVTFKDTGKTKYHRFGIWGDVAVSTEAPVDMFDKWYTEADEGELQAKMDEIDDKYFDIAFERAMDRISKLEDELFG